MGDGDSMTDHLNSFNTMVSQLIYVDIKLKEEDKCITLLCSLPNSYDNLVVEIGSTTKTTLKFEDVVTSLLLVEMRRKYMENHSINAFLMRPGHTKARGKSTGAPSKSRVRCKSPEDSLKKLY